MMKEKANPKSAAPRKVKGTVLFTVVCVMMVLIVFMMGTLALAATANKRAYQNYQKTQTAAYARAVLDSAIEAIQNDTGTTGGFKDQIANNTSLTMQVSTGADGLASDVTITRTGEVRRVYDEDSDSWVDGNVYRLSTTMTSESTGVETEYVAFLIDGYNTTGTPRRVNNNNNPRAFVSGGYSNGAATAGYFIGGSSINIGSTPVQITMGNQARYMAPFYANATDLTFNAQTSVVFNKVAPSNFFAVSGDFHPGNDFTVNWDNMSDVWTGSAWDHSHGTAWPSGDVGYEEIPCIYVGGTFYKSTNDLKLSLGNNGTAAQLPLNLYCGSFESAGTSKFEMTGDMYCFDENKTSHLTTQNNGTALYKWSAANINEMGTAKNTQFGSVYSKGSFEMSQYNVEGDVRIEKNFTYTARYGSNCVINGDLVVGQTFNFAQDNNGKLNVRGNIYAGKIVSNGELSCNGTIYCYEWSGSQPQPANVSILPTPAPSGNAATWYTDSPGVYVEKNQWWNGFKGYMSITKHVKLNGVETTEVITANTGNEDGANDEADYRANNVNFQNLMNIYNGYMAHNSEATASIEPFYDYDVAGKYGKAIYPDPYTQANLLANVVEEPVMTDYNFPTTLAELDNGTAILPGNPGTGEYDLSTEGTSEANAINRSGILKGNINSDLYFKPVGTVIVQVENVNLNFHNIVVDDTQGSVIFFVTAKHTSASDPGYDLTLNGAKIWTKSYRDKLTNIGSYPVNHAANQYGLEIEEVQPDASSEFYPNIYIYSEDGAKMNCQNNSMFTANVNAQKMNFTSATAYHVTGGEISYYQTIARSNGTAIRSHSVVTGAPYEGYVGCIGQLICNETQIANQWTLIYVCLDNSSGSGGGGGGGSVTPVTTVVPDYFANMYYNFY